MNPRFMRELGRRFAVGGRLPDPADVCMWVDVPVARNRRFVVAAVIFGAPWLLALVIGSGVFLVAAPVRPFLIRVMAWLVAVLLLIFIHVLAAMAVWGAFYQAAGTETFVIDDTYVQVLRTALGITLPARVGRFGVGHATVLPEWHKRSPQPKIEVKTAKGAVRFGAGISRIEAQVIADRVNAFFSAEENERVDLCL
ncbi:MAG: hypothetical protein Q7J82_04570 [Coriobacteriia bacterium]|nr:hypothetical protein [Coriobacteriia bacterium]